MCFIPLTLLESTHPYTVHTLMHTHSYALYSNRSLIRTVHTLRHSLTHGLLTFTFSHSLSLPYSFTLFLYSRTHIYPLTHSPCSFSTSLRHTYGCTPILTLSLPHTYGCTPVLTHSLPHTGYTPILTLSLPHTPQPSTYLAPRGSS